MKGQKILITKIEVMITEILNMQGTEEDSKAAQDIYVLKDLLYKREASVFHPLEVDHRLRNEYKTIEKIEKHSSARDDGQVNMRRCWNNDILNHLNNDLIGIYIEMAIEHKILSSYDNVEYTASLCIR